MSDDQTFTQDDIDAAVKKASAEVEGLKTKNQEILDELKTTRDSLKKFEGVDVDEFNRLSKVFAENEDAQLIADGKVQDVIDKRTEKMRQKFEDRLEEITSSFEAAAAERDTFRNQLHSNRISDAIRKECLESGMRTTAIDDAILQGRTTFTVGEDGEVEARDGNGELKKVDGKLLTPKAFVTSLRKSKPHYWPDSEGAGTTGGGNRAAAEELGEVAREAARTGDMKKFREMRDQQRGRTRPNMSGTK
jgi:hypothetical protein